MGHTNTKKFIHCMCPIFILVKSDTLSLLESPLGIMSHFFFCLSYTKIICFLDLEFLEGKNYVLFSSGPLHPNLIPGMNVFWIRLKWRFSGLIGKVGWGQGRSLCPWEASFLGVEGPVHRVSSMISRSSWQLHPEWTKNICLRNNAHSTLQMSLHCPGPLSLMARTLNRYSVLGVRLCSSRFCCIMSRICPQSSVRTLLGGEVMSS